MLNNKISNKIAILVLCLAATALMSCGANRALGAILPGVVPVATSPATSQVNPAGADAHFVLLDDYFILEEPLGESAYVYSAIAKMKAAPTPAINNQARFQRSMDGQSVLTMYYSKTKIAGSADLVVGKEVYILDRTDPSGNLRAPASSDEKNSSYWINARITDISQKAQGLISLSGGFQANVNSIRVASQ